MSPLTVGGDAGIFGLDRRGGLRCLVELLEGVSADVRDRSRSDASSETSERCCRRDADRVTGAKYPSRASDLSEREGDGEITRGVSGTILGVEGMPGALTMKDGSAGAQMRPNSGRAQGFVLAQAIVPQGNSLLDDSMMAIVQGENEL